MKLWKQMLLPALVLGAVLAACNSKQATEGGGAPSTESATSSAPTTSGANAPAPGAKLRLAFVTNNAADFWASARGGCEKAAEELGDIDMSFVVTGDGTAATQQRNVDDLLAKGIDGIAISPVDPANQTPMLNKVASQALLITQDSDAPKSNRACYIGTDNFAAGRQAGEQIEKALPNGGSIMIFVGKADAQNAQDRIGGIKEVLKDTNIKIIDVRTDDTDLVRAKSNALDAIVKYPDVACLVGIWSYNGPAIVNAVKESGKAGQIKIVCFDDDDGTMQGLKDGLIEATVVQQPFEFGRQAMTVMEKTLKGDKTAIPADKKIIIPTLVIDKSSVDAYWIKLKALKGQK